jgi:hypothetical protein
LVPGGAPSGCVRSQDVPPRAIILYIAVNAEERRKSCKVSFSLVIASWS